MTKLFAAGILLFSLSACNNNAENKTASNDTMMEKKDSPVAASSVLTDTEKADGWELLFDGQSFAGWHRYGGGPVGSSWKAENGMIYLDTAEKKDWQVKGGGDIVTDAEYDNFDLKLDWKISPKGNSGIMFYIQEDSVKYKWPWETGPEMQVVDNEGHPDGKIFKHQAGDLYDLIPCNKKTVKPAGEWNAVEIKSMNGKLELWLNGENVVTTQLWDENWKKLIAGSKFSKMPGFGTFKKGRIGLQDHGNMVWFRNIRIKKG